MDEVEDFVLCLYNTIGDISEELKFLTEHQEECEDPECVETTKERIGYLTWRKEALQARTADLGPRLAKQKEHLEFLIAKKIDPED